MNAITQRAFSRNRYVAPILFSDCNKKQFRKAVMHNSSVGGMYFESRHPVFPGTSLVIQLVDFPSDPYWPEACDSYLADTRWCIEKMGDDHPVYGVGVRFVMSTCTQCGARITHCCMEGVDLCPECQEDILTISDSKLKGCLENYYLGNIL
ncbi:MAG: hypothetical protein ACOCWY_06160 [Thermodesulfobacteriota bacterium]